MAAPDQFGGADPVLERAFRGHTGAVNALVFNPNMRQLISGGEDGSLLVWHFKPSLRAYRFTGHKAAVHAVAFSAQNGLLASASKDRTVRLWLPTAEGQSSVLKAHAGAVRAVDFSPNGRLLLTAGDDKAVKLWALPQQRFAAALGSHSNWVRCAAFSPDGRLVASGGDDKSLRLWDVETRTCVALCEHGSLVHACSWHPDGSAVATGASDGGARLWDARTKQLVQLHGAHLPGAGAARSVAFHPGGAALLSAHAGDACLRLWDLRRACQAYTMHGHAAADGGNDKGLQPGAVSCVFSPKGDFFASGGGNAQILVWRTNAGHVVADEPPAEDERFVYGRTARAGGAGVAAAPLGASTMVTRRVHVPPPTQPPWRAKGRVPGQRDGPVVPAAMLPRPEAAPSPTPEPDDGTAQEAAFQSASAVAQHVAARAVAAVGRSHWHQGQQAPPAGGLAGDGALGGTLSQLVQQMEVMTQTLAMLEARLTIQEDQTARIAGQPALPPARA